MADDTARRIALAWRELRRGASGAALRRHLLGPDAPSLEQAQLDALEILASRPAGWRMSLFADALRLDPSTATRAVNRLEQLGLAERTTDRRDRRVVIATATAAGSAMVRRVTRLRALGMERLLEPFDDDERERFADHLERFVASIDQLIHELDRDA
ncbi:MAG TPA: MarR family transcriptional regulator [Ilumatobacter sp.]